MLWADMLFAYTVVGAACADAAYADAKIDNANKDIAFIFSLFCFMCLLYHIFACFEFFIVGGDLFYYDFLHE